MDAKSLAAGGTRGDGVRAATALTESSIPTAGSAVPKSQRQMAVLVTGLFGIFCWAYWPVLVEMAKKWWSDPQFSHALLVPPFAVFLAWRRWNPTEFLEGKTSLWGLVLMLIGVGLRLAGARYFVDFFEAISILPILAGAMLLVFGWGAIRQMWPAIAFLFFMIPLPFRIETGLSLPLQRIATQGSTYVLQTMGLPAFNEGNVIVIGDTRVGVVEACNGLGMFLMFIAVSFGVAMLVQRPLWQKIVLLLSSVPIAVGVNIVRVVMTTMAYQFLSKKLVDSVAHDFAGWLMMPLAIIALMVVLKLLSKAFVEVEAVPERRPVALNTLHGSKAPRKRSAPTR